MTNSTQSKEAPDVLVGSSGYVGSTLLRQASFARLFRSSNIAGIRGGSYHRVLCAGAPAQKWIANREPDADRRNIEALMEHLDTVSCQRFILISTVDVFAQPQGVDERTAIVEEGLNAYGLNRRLLEKFVESRFPGALIVRLPGLVGPGLRKNVIFDLLNNNNLGAIDSRGVFQFYPMVNLWFDLLAAEEAGLQLLHLTAEPISVEDLARLGFGRKFDQHISTTPVRYDMRTCHAELFGGDAPYQYSSRETVQAIRAYAQTEVRAAV